MSDRRFSESEIREVFERAAREQEQAAQRSTQEGLTLAEMQDVAASAGIAPEFVAAAARSVALGDPEAGRMMVGPVPRGVFRTEFLPGPPTDPLWEHVVADCRRTFRAKGEATVVGNSHEWRNSNLAITLEPAGDGSRLHMRTRRDAVPMQATGAGVLVVVGLFAAFASTLNAGFDPEGLPSWLMMIVGGLVWGASIWGGQRSWAATRERQMAEIAERAAAASGPTATAPVDVASASGRIDAGLLDLGAPEAASPSGTRSRTT